MKILDHVTPREKDVELWTAVSGLLALISRACPNFSLWHHEFIKAAMSTALVVLNSCYGWCKAWISLCWSVNSVFVCQHCRSTSAKCENLRIDIIHHSLLWTNALWSITIEREGGGEDQINCVWCSDPFPGTMRFLNKLMYRWIVAWFSYLAHDTCHQHSVLHSIWQRRKQIRIESCVVIDEGLG